MWLEVLYSRHYAGFGGVTELTASTSLRKLYKFLWPPNGICARLLRARWMMVINLDQNRQAVSAWLRIPPQPKWTKKARSLWSSESLLRQRNTAGKQWTWLSTSHVNVFGVMSDFLFKKPGNIEGSQTVEYQCLQLSTSNQFAEQIHLCTWAGERGYQVYTHAGCVAEKNQYFAWYLQWFLSYFLASVLNCRRILLTLKYKTW